MLSDFSADEVWRKIFPQPNYRFQWHNGTCGLCGKETQVQPLLSEKGELMYWSRGGGSICFCKECKEKWHEK